MAEHPAEWQRGYHACKLQMEREREDLENELHQARHVLRPHDASIDTDERAEKNELLNVINMLQRAVHLAKMEAQIQEDKARLAIYHTEEDAWHVLDDMRAEIVSTFENLELGDLPELPAQPVDPLKQQQNGEVSHYFRELNWGIYEKVAGEKVSELKQRLHSRFDFSRTRPRPSGEQ